MKDDLYLYIYILIYIYIYTIYIYIYNIYTHLYLYIYIYLYIIVYFEKMFNLKKLNFYSQNMHRKKKWGKFSLRIKYWQNQIVFYSLSYGRKWCMYHHFVLTTCICSIFL